MIRRSWLYFVLSVVIAGCSTLSELEESVDESNDLPDSIVGYPPEVARWMGETSDKLVEELGEPSTVIEATLLGGPHSVALVYQRPDRGCVDAYVVVVDTRQIIKWFCR
jgi:hypothetical protein